MVDLHETLGKIGLGQKEACLFLASLELGPQPASVLAKKVGLTRPNAYSYLKSLLNKGLFSSFLRGGIRIYEALDPPMLLRYIDNKRLYLNDCKRDIQYLLPNFTALMNKGRGFHGASKVQYFEGIEGVKIVMEDTLTSKDPLFCYSSLSCWLKNPELSSYIHEYVKRRMFEKKIPIRGVVFDKNYEQRCLSEDYKGSLYNYKYISSDVINNETNIYGDKVAIVSLKKDNYFGLIIESPQIASTQKMMFEIMWSSAGEV